MRTPGRTVLIILSPLAGFLFAPVIAETAGIATLLVVAALFLLYRRGAPVALSTAAFGAGCTASIGLFMARSPWIYSGPGTLSYAVSQLAIGVALLVAGVTFSLHPRRRTAA